MRVRSGIFSRKPNVSLFSASIQARVSAEPASSSQRYGSATLVPKKSSTWSTFVAGGYLSGGGWRSGVGDISASAHTSQSFMGILDWAV
jgi:hypothetical protein